MRKSSILSSRWLFTQSSTGSAGLRSQPNHHTGTRRMVGVLLVAVLAAAALTQGVQATAAVETPAFETPQGFELVERKPGFKPEFSSHWGTIATSSDGYRLAATELIDSTEEYPDEVRYFTCKIWTSQDGGISWSNVHTFEQTYVCDLQSSDSGAKLVMYASHLDGYAVYTSSDYGETWIASSGLPSQWYIDFAISPSADDIYMLSGYYGQEEIWVSHDFGASWNLGVGNPLTDESRAIATSADGSEAFMSGPGLWRTDDGGLSWSPRGDLQEKWRGLDIAVSDDGAFLLYATYGWIMVSSDHGHSWTRQHELPGGGRSDILTAISADGSTQVVTAGDFLHTSADHGETWLEQDIASLGSISSMQLTPGGESIVLSTRAGLFTGSRTASTFADTYVALGDSFQSGEGAHSYEAGTDTAPSFCHRSNKAYPKLLVERRVVQLDLNFRACSGAVIADLSLVAAPTGTVPWPNGQPQLAALNKDTKLVTLGIGGNDAGFVDVLESCFKRSVGTGLIPINPLLLVGMKACEDGLGDKVDASLKSLDSGAIHRELLQLYRDVRRLAPNARVIVVSYPRFYPLEGANFGVHCEGLRIGDQQWLNDVVSRADFSIGMAAISTGFEYVNMLDVMEGQELCTANSGMNGVKFGSPAMEFPKAPESFHPTAVGHDLMADKIADHLGTVVEPSFELSPLQTVTRTLQVDGNMIHINTTWPGSDVETTLISPSGLRYDRGNLHDAKHGNGPTYEYFEIDQPESGIWTFEIYGADVAPGEPVIFSAVDVQEANKKPVAAFSVTGSGLAYHFDASASSDPDGVIASYSWDFGDGITATGPTVDHVFPTGTNFTVVLGVEDDDGVHDFESSDRTVGIGPATDVFVDASTTLSGTTSLTGPAHILGDFTCTSDASVIGDVFVSGNVYLTKQCLISGNLRAGGTVKMDATPHVAGSVLANGSVTFVSTAQVSGSITTAGAFISPDGHTPASLNADHSVGGAITAQSTVQPYIALSSNPITANPSSWSGFAAKTWVAWMNGTAASNGAVSGSAGMSMNPGCVMAPWASSVNGTRISVDTDTFVDARGSGCSAVKLQGMTLNLNADLTIFANGFESVNGLAVNAPDGMPHKLTITVAGSAGCGSASSIVLSPNTTTSPLVTTDLAVAGKLTVNGPANVRGKVDVGCLATSGYVVLGAR